MERKNCDLKPRQAILVGEEHTALENKLSQICFATNTSACDTTDHTAAYQQFGRQLRNDRYPVWYPTSYPQRWFHTRDNPLFTEVCKLNLGYQRVEQKQDRQKENFDRRRRQKYFKPGDKVWVTVHPVSHNNRSKKLMSKQEGPNLILIMRSPITRDCRPDPGNLCFCTEELLWNWSKERHWTSGSFKEKMSPSKFTSWFRARGGLSVIHALES